MARGSGSKVVRTQRGTLELSSPAERTSFIRMEGHMQAEHARAIVDFGKALVAEQAGPHASFHDYADMAGYDSAARQLLTQWGIEVRDRVTEVHVLTASKLVAMGVATAALGLSMVGTRLVAYTDRAAFERALADRVRAV